MVEKQLFSKKRYGNLDDVNTIRSMKELQQWRKERKRKVKDFTYRVPREPEPDIAYLHHNRTTTTITWIGHASFLVQIGGLNIVIDPIWTTFGPFMRRLSAPGLTSDQLPPIDVVLISHGHYDHLQFSSLKQISGNPLYLVPAGLSRLLKRRGYQHCEELEWWQTRQIGDTRISFVPSQHWTRRTLWDTNSSHWGGWVLEGAGDTVYFAGDSGYFRGFREIGERFNIDVALMPIGAYEPEWFMGPQHVTPEEAVQAFLDVRASRFIPMHYGAFHLADDTPKEALDRLHSAWNRRELDTNRLLVLKLGEIYTAKIATELAGTSE